MESNVSSDAAELDGGNRFLPASLVFILVHVLFLGGAIFLAALN